MEGIHRGESQGWTWVGLYWRVYEGIRSILAYYIYIYIYTYSRVYPLFKNVFHYFLFREAITSKFTTTQLDTGNNTAKHNLKTPVYFMLN